MADGSTYVSSNTICQNGVDFTNVLIAAVIMSLAHTKSEHLNNLSWKCHAASIYVLSHAENKAGSSQVPEEVDIR